MSNEFIEYLVRAGKIGREAADKLERWMHHARQPIGMIALSHGLMSGHAIDEVLQRQSETKERFGEIAVMMAFLTPVQVDRLLEVQRFRRNTTAAEGICLAGLLPLEGAVQYFADFLRNQAAAQKTVVPMTC